MVPTRSVINSFRLADRRFTSYSLQLLVIPPRYQLRGSLACSINAISTTPSRTREQTNHANKLIIKYSTMCMIFTNRFPERRGKYWAENNDPIHQNPLLLDRPALWIISAADSTLCIYTGCSNPRSHTVVPQQEQCRLTSVPSSVIIISKHYYPQNTVL